MFGERPEIKNHQVQFSNLDSVKKHLKDRIDSLNSLTTKGDVLNEQLSTYRYLLSTLEYVKTLHELKSIVITIQYTDGTGSTSHQFYTLKEFMNFLRMPGKEFVADALGFDVKENKLTK